MGAEFIDYITTDMTTTTPEMADQFDEYYLALPYSYMMSDHRSARCLRRYTGFQSCNFAYGNVARRLVVRAMLTDFQELAQRSSGSSCGCKRVAAEVRCFLHVAPSLSNL
jgi:hypothetical protein